MLLEPSAADFEVAIHCHSISQEFTLETRWNFWEIRGEDFTRSAISKSIVCGFLAVMGTSVFFFFCVCVCFH